MNSDNLHSPNPHTSSPHSHDLALSTRKIQQSISLSLGTISALKRISRDENLSVSELVREALIPYLETNYSQYL